MKALYTADMHGDLQALEIVRDYAQDKRNIEAVINSGDLISPIFNDKEMENLGDATYVLSQVRAQNRINATLENLAKNIAQKLDSPEELRGASKFYIDSLSKTRESTNEQYEKIKKIFDSFNLPVLTIPGNWDTTNIDDYLAQENLHLKHKKEINGVTFGGYGASYERMMGVLPQELEINFSEKELYNFLKEQDPDIALIHCPPYRMHDADNNGNPSGTLGALAYLLDEKPSLVLSGHSHLLGIDCKGNNCSSTVILNAGNLGRYLANTGRHNGNFGTFVEFELENNSHYFKNATFYHITDMEKGKDSIEKMAEFEMTEEGPKNITEGARK